VGIDRLRNSRAHAQILPDGRRHAVRRDLSVKEPDRCGSAAAPALALPRRSRLRWSSVSDLTGNYRRLFDLIDPSLVAVSGEVFYSGRSAFENPSPIYLLGLNPGGDPAGLAEWTIGRDIASLRERDDWSAYADESWGGLEPGKSDFQRHVLHLFEVCGLDARRVPASNVIFKRTRSEAEIGAGKRALLDACWPVHHAVIQSLGVGVVVCLGGPAGGFVRKRLDAHDEIDAFVETNDRGWASRTHQATGGIQVVTLTHPSRAKWSTAPKADPSLLVKRALARLIGSAVVVDPPSSAGRPAPVGEPEPTALV